ncbi:MAG TPA: penicillin-binding protein 2 [Candidatus Coprovicinus avistercoris]|uniref:Penicillin-binding protein 2 n=1 Tax=Candidatus Coprovicinus avistercoris TaxID=2840754 RepID=A0A9D1HY38_9ACTN|nr:penicillin-binding protein 2 [Candidatus Coprovicinus avistercoris]
MSAPLIIALIIIVALIVIALAVWFISRSGAGRFTFDIGGQTPRAAGGEDTSAESGTKSRLLGLAAFSAGVFALLTGKLWSMMLVSSDKYTSMAESNRTRSISLPATRGRILDRNGEELVTNRPSLAVAAESSVLDDEIELRLLSNLLGMPYIAAKRKVQDQSEGAQSARTVSIDVKRRIVAYLGEHADIFPGVTVEERTQRSYPQGSLAAHLLGYTGSVTQEQHDASQESNDEGSVAYEMGDIVGQAGIEYQYENVLQGVRGEQRVFVDADGNITDYSTTVPPVSGSDIVLTIDSTIQAGAEAGLKHAIEESRAKGNKDCDAGAVVVLDATNGEVLALASAPTFEPSVFVGGISNDDWNALSSEESDNPLMNRAVSGQYMSASTIKPLTAFAALDYGIATPDSGYDCTGFWTGFGEASGQYCWDHDGHGYMTLQTGITFSCDVVFYEIGKGFWYADEDKKLGMQDTFEKWGLGSATGIDLPSEASGRVPTPDWKWNYFSDYSDEDRSWKGGDNTNIAIGQGDILVTPMQMCCVYAGIANRGTIWRPHLLKSIQARSGDGTISETQGQELLTAEEDASYFDLVHTALEGVIYEEDASTTAHFTNLSVRVAGKTGSGERPGEPATGWFCVYAPADNPKYVIAAVIEQGGFGATSAMYAVRDTLGAIYNEPDTQSSSNDTATE